MEAQGNRLAVVVRTPDEREHIVIIDLKRGGVIAKMALEAAP